MATRPRTVTISLPPALARKVDQTARAEGRTRSELFREAVRQYLDRIDRWDRIFAFGDRVAREQGLTEDDVARAVRERRSGGDRCGSSSTRTS